MSFVVRGPSAPCAGQTREAIEEWMRANVRLDAEVVVRYAAGGRLRYERGRVVGLDSALIRVAVRRRDGAYEPLRGGFYHSGKSRWNPAGLSHLVIPTPEVIAACVACEENGRAQKPRESSRSGN